MRILIIQENGRHEKNRNFRECFCLQRAFSKLNIYSEVWGLGHHNFEQNLNFDDYDLIINLENYGGFWEPDLSKVKSKKFLWSIDAHARGENPFLFEFKRGDYNLLLHSTKNFVNENFKIWFPNAFDEFLISPIDIDKKCDVGFCGNILNRGNYINPLSQNFNFIHDNFVIGEDMVKAISSYKIHWNKNISIDINYRNFETIGCGIPLVTNYNPQYTDLGFIDGENVIFYTDLESMLQKIKHLINNENLRLLLSKNSLELSKKHTYTERAKKIIQLYKELL